MAGGSTKLFQFAQKCHRIFGILPFQANKKRRHLSTKSIQSIFLISYTLCVFTIGAFFFFEAESMFDYGFTFFALVNIIMSIAIYMVFIWQSENTLEFIENCERFIENRAHSKVAYNELAKKIEWFNQFLCYAMMASFFLIMLPVTLLSYVNYYIFNMGEDSFYVFFPFWFPFDCKTPVGYLMAWLSQCVVGVTVTSTFSQFLNLVFGSCWLFIFIADDIIQDVIAFNFTTSNKNCTEMVKRFCNMVQTYSDAKQCVMRFNHVFAYSLFALFAYDMLAISSLLVIIQFQLWANDANFIEISFLILVLIWLTSTIFLLCEPGARMTKQFNEFCDELNRCDWYLLTIELRRWYAIFLSDTQNPIKMSCYANITCERETSKKIIDKAFSYFMTLRRLKP